MQVPLLDLKTQYAAIKEETREAIDRVLDSQRFILGPEVEALENEVAAYCGCRFGIGVSSGTDALLVAMMAVGVGPGDEVVTTAYSFFATAGCIARLGATPVFVDIDPATFNLDPGRIDAAVTSRTKAILPVHLFGQMADMEPILEVARKRGLTVIEDAAQAIGSEELGKRGGSLGDLGCFSFFPSKNLGGFGDGGMVTCQDERVARRVRLLRSHGSENKYYNHLIGGNFRLDALQAAVLRVKLKHLDNWTAARRRNAAIYRELFHEAAAVATDPPDCMQSGCSDLSVCRLPERLNQIVLPWEAPGKRHIYNQFVIRAARRDDLLRHLRSRGIGCEVYYPLPLHCQECFSYLGVPAGSFPASACAARSSLALPVYPELDRSMLETVVGAIVDFTKVERL